MLRGHSVTVKTHHLDKGRKARLKTLVGHTVTVETVVFTKEGRKERLKMLSDHTVTVKTYHLYKSRKVRIKMLKTATVKTVIISAKEEWRD